MAAGACIGSITVAGKNCMPWPCLTRGRQLAGWGVVAVGRRFAGGCTAAVLSIKRAPGASAESRGALLLAQSVLCEGRRTARRAPSGSPAAVEQQVQGGRHRWQAANGRPHAPRIHGPKRPCTPVSPEPSLPSAAAALLLPAQEGRPPGPAGCEPPPPRLATRSHLRRAEQAGPQSLRAPRTAAAAAAACAPAQGVAGGDGGWRRGRGVLAAARIGAQAPKLRQGQGPSCSSACSPCGTGGWQAAGWGGSPAAPQRRLLSSCPPLTHQLPQQLVAVVPSKQGVQHRRRALLARAAHLPIWAGGGGQGAGKWGPAAREGSGHLQPRHAFLLSKPPC